MSLSDSVLIKDLGYANINPTLFCIAIGNLIKNGVAYNDNNKKRVKIYLSKEKELVIEDNGTGLTQMEYDLQCMPYMRENRSDNDPSGLGINIANAILEEHGYTVSVDRIETGTLIKVKI